MYFLPNYKKKKEEAFVIREKYNCNTISFIIIIFKTERISAIYKIMKLRKANLLSIHLIQISFRRKTYYFNTIFFS